MLRRLFSTTSCLKKGWSKLDLSDVNYWKTTYAKQIRDGKEKEKKEWFVSAETVLDYSKAKIQKNLLADNRNNCIVELGCGSSNLPYLLAKAFPHCKVIGVDASEEAIEINKNNIAQLENSSNLSFSVQNVLDLSTFQDEHVNIVVDKGTLDAMVHGDITQGTELSCQNSQTFKMVSEIQRILKDDGLFVHVSDEDPEIRLDLLRQLTRKGKDISVSFSEIEGQFSNFIYFVQSKSIT